MKVGGFSKLSAFLKSIDEGKRDCFVDTSVLFSDTYPLGHYNADSEMAFEALALLSVPAITNQNVRSEFLENHRRVLLAECLVDFYEDFLPSVPINIGEKLKSHRTNIRRKVDEGKDAKLNTNQIKDFRELLRPFAIENVSAWDFICAKYLRHRITPLWNATVAELGINVLTSRANEVTPYLKTKLDWDDAVDLMGKYGIASADAMILNIFFCSTVPILITADVEMARCVLKENQTDKVVFLPDSLSTI